MGFYGSHVLPRLVNFACDTKPVAELRRRVCDGLSGEVIEIGFGSGLNVPFYPAGVERLVAVEPEDLGWKLAAKRVRASRVMIERAGLDAEALPFPDQSFDAALSTYTLCTVPDAAVALSELRRVLKPGGSLHFLEHGLAPDDDVRRLQYRLDPLQRRVFGGCHLTRPIVDMLTNAGFAVTDVDEFYQNGAPRFGAHVWLGVAKST